jgi:hypothetical protein
MRGRRGGDPGNHERSHGAILHLGEPGPGAVIVDQVAGAFQSLCPPTSRFGMVAGEPEPAEKMAQGTRYESGADAQRYG